MVGRNSPQFSGQARAAQVLKFVRMDLERKTQILGGFENAPGLRKVEGAFFAENIHKRQRACQRRGCSTSA